MAGRYFHVHERQFGGARGWVEGAEQVDLLGQPPSDQPGKPRRAAPAWRDANVDLRHAPAGARRSDHEVTRHRDLKTTADGITVNPGDRDLVQLFERVGHVLVAAHATHHVVGITPARHLRDVVARAECATGALDDDHFQARAVPDPLESMDQLVGQRDRQCIAYMGPVQRQPGDRSLLDVIELRVRRLDIVSRGRSGLVARTSAHAAGLRHLRHPNLLSSVAQLSWSCLCLLSSRTVSAIRSASTCSDVRGRIVTVTRRTSPFSSSRR